MLRDHEPIVIEEFNGLWMRGDPEAAPPDHFSQAQNIQFEQSGFKTRDGLDTYKAYGNVLRIYTYVYITSGGNSAESLLILDTAGNIYHDTSPTPFTPILTIAAMTDFGFVAIAGRAFINPMDGNLGLAGEHIYVYKGDGTPARKAGGAPPSGTLSLANSGSGNNPIGVRVYGVAFETDTGFITQIAAFASINDPGGDKVDITSIPISSDPSVVARRLVSTIAIDPTLFTGDLKNGYEFFFIPTGRIADNTTTSLSLDFFDNELLEDASYTLNLFTNIPAGVGLCSYNNRMVSWAEAANPSLARISYVGQPEAMDQVSGLVIVPLDSNPLTNGAAFRGVLYLFKTTRTVAYIDNGDVPSTWPLTVIEEGLGASIHGIAQVLDSGGTDIDYLIVTNLSGIFLFTGTFSRPELTYKIKDFWLGLARAVDYKIIQVMNNTVGQILFLCLFDQILIGDYANGLDPKNIRWALWVFNIAPSTITLIDIDKLIIGSANLI